MLPSKLMIKRDWHHLVLTYSSKEFTSSTDRLAALAGLVKWYSKRFELTPVLGLWLETLILDLGWQSGRKDSEGAVPRRSTIAGLPSWTWLVWDGHVQWPFYRGLSASVTFLRVINYNINWAREPMSSRLKGLYLRVRARLKTMMLSTPQDPKKDGLKLEG